MQILLIFYLKCHWIIKLISTDGIWYPLFELNINEYIPISFKKVQ